MIARRRYDCDEPGNGGKVRLLRAPLAFDYRPVADGSAGGGGLIVVDRVSSSPYKWKVGMAPLAKVANVEKMMPKNFITKDGFGITDKCREYLLPLIKGEDYPPYKNGLPQYVQLKNVAVAKKLKTGFELKK